MMKKNSPFSYSYLGDSLMKNFYKSLGLLGIMVFSFYYTEKIAVIMQNKSPIMQSINQIENNYLESPVNATIEGEGITPGIMGRMINKTKSYVNMKSFGIFNEYYLVFDDVKPEVSLEDHKDKIITKGNKKKNAISFLIEDNPLVKDYFLNQKIQASIFINESNFDKNSFFEQINIDKETYKNTESLLNKNNLNTNICYVNIMEKDFCVKNKKYLVAETMSLNNSNFIEIKKNLESGAIILIKENTSLENVKLLLKEIQFKGLKILTLSDLINEKKD